MTIRDASISTHDARLQQALLQHRAGNLIQAEALYGEILQAEPQHADANYYLGLLTAQRGQPEAALPFLKTALDANPVLVQYWLSYAEMLLAAGQAPAALALMQQAKQRGFSSRSIEALMARAGGSAAAGAPPTDAAALYASARQLHQSGRLSEAIALYGRALLIKPDHAEAHNNLGTAFAQSGRLDEAAASYDRALGARSDYAEAHSNLGNVLAQLGRLEDAAVSYRRALSVKPDYAEAHSNLGNVLAYQGRLDEAVKSYRRALAIRPDYADAHCNVGNIFMRQNRLDEAEASYRRTLAINLDHAKAHNLLGTVLCAIHQVEAGFASFTRHAELVYGRPDRRPRNSEPTPPHRAQHDRAQREYLTKAGLPDDGRSLDDVFHLADGSRLAGPAINRGNAIGEISERWRQSRPQIAIIDNLLTDEALEKLRRFCWGSTVWRKNYEAGYLAALLEYGFSCPLLAQIADELRDVYPAIFGSHPLLHLWAFKYDSQLKGVALHADNAAINVNFWITTDEANLEPGTGGLIVWNIPAPLDWDYTRYNGDLAASRGFLARNRAQSVTVPYRSNRAVIFDSDLFHETDHIAFKDGYTDRRINVTLLYGRR